MTVSVPQVHPIEDLKWRLACLMQQALDEFRSTGNFDRLDQAQQLVRQLYDGEMKLAGNKGTMDWGYIERCGKAIEKVESVIQRAKNRAR